MKVYIVQCTDDGQAGAWIVGVYLDAELAAQVARQKHEARKDYWHGVTEYDTDTQESKSILSLSEWDDED